MNELLKSLLPVGFLFLASMVHGAETQVGWVEHVTIQLTDTAGKKHVIPVEAKIDTGAKTSSLHAPETKIFEKDGKELVRFSFSAGNKKYEAEYPVLIEKNVKSSDGEGESRHFIEVEMCLAGTKERILVSLNDRGAMCYPLLLGRRFLEKKFLVDSGNKFLLGKPKCQ